MHARAVEKGVPFRNIPPADVEYAVDAVLQPYKNTIIGGASIPVGSYPEIKRKYVHYSANYDAEYPIIGSPMRPGANNRRTIHRNIPGQAD